MARKKRKIKTSWIRRVSLNSDISRGLVAILFFVIGMLSALAFFDLAGVVGEFIDSLLALVFGQVRYVFPMILITISALMIKELEYEYRSTHILGAVLFFIGFNGLVHLGRPLEDMYSIAMQGYGGGLSGLALSFPLLKYVGYWGGVVILSAIILISIIFLFNTTLAQIVNINKKLFLGLGWIGKKIFKLLSGNKQLKFKIKGKYNEAHDNEDDYEEEDDEEEEVEEKRRFFNKKKEEDDEDEEEDEPVSLASEEDDEVKNDIKFEQKKIRFYKLPSTSLLFTSKSKPTSGDIKANAEVIKETFQNFGIEVDMGEIKVGPTVTQYSLKPAKGVKLTRITALSNDLALSLAAHPIRIEAPIPGKSLVGIEVPNEKAALVTLKELLESKPYKKRENNMHIALGKDVSGQVWFSDLPKLPHLLVAGATGSGKTVCINTILLSLLFQNTPETLRLIMVDPKRVELTLYNGIPHLLTPVITDAAQTVNALKWTIGEMERRFDLLSKVGKRDILSYNKIASEKLPHIVFVIDELADLMATSASEVEAGIIRLAQMARAVGIHLIVATQRPSVEVITGLMKANIPGRIAFSVASSIDSRTILDCPGADKLLGRGDMLYLTAELSKPKRLQGAYVSEDEMKRVVNFLKGDEPPEYDDNILNANNGGSGGSLFGGGSSDYDDLFNEAKKVVIESGKASASLLQRRMRIGYARAARILDELEEAGVVGPADGSRPREVFTEHMTEHMMPEPEPEMLEEDQTMNAGGSIFDETEDDEDLSADEAEEEDSDNAPDENEDSEDEEEESEDEELEDEDKENEDDETDEEEPEEENEEEDGEDQEEDEEEEEEEEEEESEEDKKPASSAGPPKRRKNSYR